MKTITTLAMLLILTGSIAQADFGFETFTEDYQNLQGSISLNDGEIWDDPSYAIPLGFVFFLGEESFDTIYILGEATGGILSSDEVIDGGSFNAFIPVVQDIIDRGDFTGEMSLSNLSYLTEGEEGDRITKIEYNNVGFFEDDTGEDFINFQVWFHEGSNIIDYRYGASSILNPNESYEGSEGLGVGLLPLINGDLVLLQDGYVLTNDPADPDVVVFETGSQIFDFPTLFGDIPVNTVYRVGPATLGLESNELLDITVYPNPVVDQLHISYFGNIKSIEVYDARGRRLMLVNTQNNTVDLSTLTNGVYHVRILTDEGEVTKTIIKK